MPAGTSRTTAPHRAQVLLLCGLSCSGKSTFAARLAEQGWEWLSIDRDAWAAGHHEQPLPAAVQRDLKITHKRRLREAVAAGRNVVLDYALPSRSRRDEYRALAREAGADVRVLFFDVPAEELHRRLAARNAAGPGPHRVPVDTRQLDRWIASFERPGADETDVEVLRP